MALTIVNGERDDGDRWCLYCMEPVTFRAVSERWIHEGTEAYRCDPSNPLNRQEAEPAPEGLRGRKRRTRFGHG